MPSSLGNKEFEVFIGGTRIREMYMGNRQVYQYDSVAPTLVVTAPAGTSSGSPTYTTSATYTVSGTITDADSGVAAVYVNGSAATISGSNWSKSVSLSANSSTKIEVYAVDKAGNRTSTITRYAFYDSAVPSLTVSAPAGTSSSSPTTVQSDSTYSYTVKGTVSDGAGIKSVTVNGQAATISGNNWSKKLSLATNTTHTITVVATDIAGRTTTMTRYVRINRITNVGDTITAKDSTSRACNYKYTAAVLSRTSSSGSGLTVSNGNIKVAGACTISITATFKIGAGLDYGKGGGRVVDANTGAVLHSNITVTEIGYNEVKDCTWTTTLKVAAGTVLRFESYANISDVHCDATTVTVKVTAVS